MAQYDSNLFSAYQNIVSTQNAVQCEPTYDKSAKILSQFKLFEFSKNPRAPVAHNIARLPSAKNIIPPKSIARVFCKDLLGKCSANVAVLQKANKDSCDQNLGKQENCGGDYWGRHLRDWDVGSHEKESRVIKSIQYVEKLISWIETNHFTLLVAIHFQVEADPDIMSKLKSIPLLSVQAEALDLVGKLPLGDSTVNTLMLELFAERVDTIVVDTAIAGNVMNGFLPVETRKNVFLGVTGEKILIPVICSKNHWCSVVIDLKAKEVLVYDPLNSSFGVKVRTLADKLVTILPGFVPRKYRG
ncbi:hypothetical protein F442_14347 [Phytophthora nicotianae P10297]|uniref:Ubiquitin-like protease family profile domain-containing protein n=1 Tax=Phytophthora nicotianae P10297 TaxID=1317064 RepID=W2YT76_PHYNI|nr:hypothetical protein F442_14347 [Phytophthora nicotianae P10297]